MVDRGSVLAIAALLSSIAGPPAGAGEWPRFRGPNGSGVADAGRLPVTLGPEENLEWSTPVPFGRSSPVLAGDLLYLTAVEDGALVTLAVGRSDGTIRWRRELARTREDVIHTESDSSTPSPASDGENVYAFFQEIGLVSYDADGGERWRHPLGPFANYYGMASSPVLAGGELLLLCDQNAGSFLLAVDKDTGAVRWRAERPRRQLSYTTPVLSPATGDPRQAIVAGSKWVDAYDLGSGELAWSLAGIGAAPVASPTLAAGHLYVTGPDMNAEPSPPFQEVAGKHDADGDGFLTREELAGTWMADHFGWLDVDVDGRVSSRDWQAIDESMVADGWGLFGVRLPDGEGARPEIAWNYRRNVAYIPSPIVVDGVLFTADDSIVTSLDALTGTVHKRGRLGNGPARVYASPVAGDGKVYFATLEGEVVVLDASADWQVLAENDLGAPIYATPVIADGHLYIRTRERLMSFTLGKQSGETGD